MAKIDFSRKVQLRSGVELFNCTPHPVVFTDDGYDVVAFPCGATLQATPVRRYARSQGKVEIFKTEYLSSGEGVVELYEILEKAPEALILGSIISAKTYPGQVVALIPAEGYERETFARKYSSRKFITF